MVIYKTQRHRGTEDIFLSYKKIQRNLNSVFNTKTQRDKVFSRYKDNKRLKSRHKALRQRKPPPPPNPPRGTCIAADNSVPSVKAALAALCIFRTRKRHSLFVSLCLIIKKLCDSVLNNILCSIKKYVCLIIVIILLSHANHARQRNSKNS